MAVRILACVALVVAAITLAWACDGTPNNLPINTEPLTLVRSGTQGKLYQAGQPGQQFYVLHMYGTPYQMGFAHGQLLKDQITVMIPKVMQYLESQIDQYLKFLPQDLRDLIEKYGVEAGLEATYMMTKRDTPSYYYDELHGLADGSGVEYDQLLWVAMLPELIKAGCSMFGAWGPATASLNGSLIQLRALDWNTDGPFQQVPLVQVYHPNAGNGHAFAVVGFAGFVGAFTGFSSAPIGLSEKVWLSYNGTSSRVGTPWTFVVRDILQYDADVDSAISRMASTRRTCSIFVGLGDTHMNQFRGIEYSHETVNVFDDINYPILPNHPRFDGVMYWDKHMQPSHDPCMPSLLQQYYGNLTPENTIKYITAQFQTGNLHIAVYDYAKMHMYVAYASPGDGHGHNVTNAYDRQFTRLDMTAVFAEAL
eukprot:TRINITY_DN6653_c0_g1_i1.p1 TRINITY_DN6653_c0_g1~~TRINITY_DN6653_c0_g1_i1.p1  ORF type:complete len:440 (+),score=86.37 TRINITY_DN6653_c0_g1_i1:53-1321(+)